MRKATVNASRRGFTLIEVIVVLLLLSLLAAFVLPDIVDRADDADPVRAAADMGGIAQGIELFHIDVRPKFPGDLEDLVHSVSSADLDIEGQAFESGDGSSWDGPYIKNALGEVDGDAGRVAVETGFGGEVQDSLGLYDSANNTFQTTGDAGNCGPDQWIVVTIDGLTEAQFEELNDLIDGEAAEADGGNAGQSQLVGRLRFDDSADPNRTVFLTHPCRS